MHLIKQNCSLPVFPFKANLELQYIPVIAKVVKNRKDDPNSAKASGPDYIPLGAPRNCKPELSCTLADFFQCVP